MKMDTRPSSSFSGDEEEQGVDSQVQKGIVTNKKIRIIITKDEDDLDEEHQIKLEVAEPPSFESDEEEVDTKIKIEPVDIELPSSPTSSPLSFDSNPPPRKSKSDDKIRKCPHCPFKNYNPRIYENHLRAHLPGSPARPCSQCSCFVFPENRQSHRYYHQKNAWKKRLAALKNRKSIPAAVDPLAVNSKQQYNSDDDDDDAHPVLVKTEQDFDNGKSEVVNLGHVSASTFFVNEDDEMESEPISILHHSSRSLESKSGPPKDRKCPFCPYTSCYAQRVQTHLKVHEKGVTSIRCVKCGVHNLPQKRCTCSTVKSAAKKKKLPLQKRQPKKKVKKAPEWLTSPDFTGFKEDEKRNVITLRCNYCPFKIKNSIPAIKAHVKLHDPTSPAIMCIICGVFVLPKRMKLHQSIRHSPHPQLPKTFRNKMKELNKKRGRPKLDYTVEIKKCRRWYKCRRCPYKTIRRGQIDTHAGVHLEGSSAVLCELCSVCMLPEQMQTHLDTNHPASQPEEPSVKKIPEVLKCAHCPHESKVRKQYEGHSALHSEGSTAIPCPDCDIFYTPNLFTGRHICGKWKTLKRLRLVKAKRAEKMEVSSSQPDSPE